MNLTKLREIASKRTQTSWKPAIGRYADPVVFFGRGPTHGFHEEKENSARLDAEFIAAIANHIDALLDVVEAAQRQVNGSWLHYCGNSVSCFCEHRDLNKALAKLEAIE